MDDERLKKEREDRKLRKARRVLKEARAALRPPVDDLQQQHRIAVAEESPAQENTLPARKDLGRPIDVTARAATALVETTAPVKYGAGAYLALHDATQIRLDEELDRQHELADALIAVSERITEIYQAELTDAVAVLKRRADRRRKP
jgi:hypothetical protein